MTYESNTVSFEDGAVDIIKCSYRGTRASAKYVATRDGSKQCRLKATCMSGKDRDLETYTFK